MNKMRKLSTSKGTLDYSTYLSSTDHTKHSTLPWCLGHWLDCVLIQYNRVIAYALQGIRLHKPKHPTYDLEPRQDPWGCKCIQPLISFAITYPKSSNKTLWSEMQKAEQKMISQTLGLHLCWTNVSWPNHHMMKVLKTASTSSLKRARKA